MLSNTITLAISRHVIACDGIEQNRKRICNLEVGSPLFCESIPSVLLIGENLKAYKVPESGQGPGEGLESCKVALCSDVPMSARIYVNVEGLQEGLLTKTTKLEAPEGLGSISTLEPNRHVKEVERYKNLCENLMVIQAQFPIDTHGIFSIQSLSGIFKVHCETCDIICNFNT